MKKYNAAQLKSLSEFFNMGAAAWFTTGIIAPLLTGFAEKNSIFIFSVGMIMTWLFLRISLSQLRG